MTPKELREAVKAARCSSFISGPSLCKDGFPQNAGCLGLVCSLCGQTSKVVPMCQDENIPALWLNDDGSPKFFREPASPLSEGNGDG